MKEIRIHARAGQGAITTAVLLALAAFEERKEAVAFPHFGAERMGAPMNAFVRLDSQPIRIRTQVQNPDYVMILDSTLLRDFDVAKGLKEGGIILVNSNSPVSDLPLKSGAKIITVPASQIAEEFLGRADRANTAILGAFAAATGEVGLESLKKVAHTRFSGRVAQRNAEAMQKAFDIVKGRR